MTFKDDVRPDGYTREQGLAAVCRGWAPLVARAFDAQPAGVRITQVKEKFGALRIYHDPYDPAFQTLLGAIEDESNDVCEECGEPGMLVDLTGWLRTLCERDATAEGTRRGGGWTPATLPWKP